MRTTERTIKLELPATRPAQTGRTGGLWTAVKSVYRAVRNRLELNQLQELDDHQLLDIGLTRGDVNRAMTTSTFFEDPFVELRTSARNRARRMDGRR